MSKNDAINIMNNYNLHEKSRLLYIKMSEEAYYLSKI